MAKVRLTKGELKKQRDSLKRFERYLPTLQLKKQQLQMEILAQLALLEEKKRAQEPKKKSAETWIGLLAETSISFRPWLKPEKIETFSKNVAGVDVPVFNRVDFKTAEYDLFTAPLWVDHALELLRGLISLRCEIETTQQGILILRRELLITTQRVNLFEKVKIPETEENIRLIKIYIGDQMTNAVGRSKIAKKKIEEAELAGAHV